MPNDDIQDLTSALRRLAARTSNLKPVLSAIAAYQERRYQQSFDANKAPDGTPWAPLAESTKAQKRNPKPLTEDNRRIPGSRFSEVQGNSAIIGYGDPLAALHDQGFDIPPRTVVPKNRKALFWAGARHPVKRVNIPATNVPARGLIGYSQQDIREWTAITEDEIAGEFG